MYLKKQAEFKIIKKGRKYFQTLMDGKYKAKLLINENTENLKDGELVTLTVEDQSIRSSYGIELIFSAVCDKEKTEERCFLRHPRFNSLLVRDAKDLGGKWVAQEKLWVFSSIVADKVEILDELYNSELVNVEIKAKMDRNVRGDAVQFIGYSIAKAFGRDSGAKLGDGISCINGTYTSGGSVKNWNTHISEGSTFRLAVPNSLLLSFTEEEGEKWEIRVINNLGG